LPWQLGTGMRDASATDGTKPRPPHYVGLLETVESLARPSACAKKTRYGTSGDGGWWMCDSVAFSRRGCTIFSFGIGFDSSFDRAVATGLPQCTVNMFDPTPKVISQVNSDLHRYPNPRMHFYPWGIGADDEMRDFNNVWTADQTYRVQLLRLASIKHRLQLSTPPTALKVDVESAEFACGASSCVEEQLAYAGAQQVMLELHGEPQRWLPLIERMDAANYSLWHVEDGRYQGPNVTRSKRHFFGPRDPAKWAHPFAASGWTLYVCLYFVARA